MAESETENATQPPADGPASPPKCKACNKDALPLSLFCEDHQEKVLASGKKLRFPFRLRRLDVILILVLAVLLWAYPKVQKPVWQTVGGENGPGVWATLKALFGHLGGREGTQPALAGSGARPAASRPNVAAPPLARGVGKAVARAVCGNGVVEPGEQCDGKALAGASCVSLGFAGDCGTDAGCIHPGLTCLSDCRFDYSGCTAESQAAVQRFVDNGNGTATDRLTGLTWEIKCAETDCRELHDVVAKLPWQAAVTTWVASLNDATFAGHDDWRLPTLEELRTLLVALPPCAAPPCPVAAWPRNETAPGGYWSSTTFSLDRKRAWAISFGDGEAYTAEKDATLYVRAVRSGG